MKDVLGNHFKDLLFHLVHWFEYYLITAKDHSRIHQFGKKVLPGLFLGPRIRSLRGEEFGMVTY